MAKVVFWNINGRGDGFSPTLRRIAHDADILLLAESKMSDAQIEISLGLARVPYKSDFDEIELTPKLYARASVIEIEHYSSSPSKRLIFYLMETKEFGEIIIGGIHFPSKATYNGQTQLSFANNYAKWVSEVEEQRKHKRTILFGDFNMNPFEQGMIEPQAFNATLSYDIAKSGTRTSHYDHFHYFYNPMWNWQGDRAFHSGEPKLPGTLYHKTTADVTQIFWNVYDKVIVRPAIIDLVDYSTLQVHEAIPIPTLVEKDFDAIPDNFTDHQPLSFTLKITK